MERWSGVHRAFMIEAYFKSNDSYTIARRRFCANFNIRRVEDAPSKNLVKSWVRRFRATSSALNVKPRGRPRTATAPENVEAVRAAVIQNPSGSVRKTSQVVRMRKSSFHTILRRDLKFHPYKIQIVQELNPNDFRNRRSFAETMIDHFFANDRINNILFSDEAHFHLSGAVNKQNCRYWAPENPRQKHERPLHSPKVTVWCAMSASGIIGPYFFENRRGVAQTVNSDRYCAMLREFLVPQLQEFDGFDQDTWFQQDGATAHTARASMEVVRELFPEKVISRFGDLNWPARSPDLTPLDFFLWGYLKSKVYVNRPNTLQELKQKIREEINGIPPEMFWQFLTT